MARMAILLPLLLAAAAAAADARAGEIHRCRGADGVMAYRDTPCPEAQQALGTLVLRAEPGRRARADRDEQRRIAAWERASRARLPESLGGSGGARETRGARAPARGRDGGARREAPDPCSEARRARDAAYARRDSPAGFDERRRLQDALDAACGPR